MSFLQRSYLSSYSVLSLPEVSNPCPNPLRDNITSPELIGLQGKCGHCLPSNITNFHNLSLQGMWCMGAKCVSKYYYKNITPVHGNWGEWNRLKSFFHSKKLFCNSLKDHTSGLSESNFDHTRR